MTDFFNFEDKDRDFPFYRDNPRISKIQWIVLLLLVPVSFIFYGIIGIYSEFLGSILFVLIMLIPLLYFSKWNYSLMFQKPTKKQILLALSMFAGYIIYSFIVGSLIDSAGFASSGELIDTEAIGLESLVSLIFSMMGEELVKFIPLMFLMRIIYKFSDNRKISVVISSAIVMMGFGMMHYTGSIVEVLLIQGLGSIFEFYGYIKTKNVYVPYMSHLFTDAFLFTLMLIGF